MRVRQSTTLAGAAVTSLRDTLAAYARGIPRSGDASEPIQVDVVRQDGFLHRAGTTSGQTLVLDEPVAFGGHGSAPDPAECLLAAVGASVSVTVTAHAALRDVPIEGIHVGLGAVIDAREFFHPGSGGKPGLLNLTLTLTIRTGAPRKVVRATIRDALRVAPVLRTLKRMPRVIVVYEPL